MGVKNVKCFKCRKIITDDYIAEDKKTKRKYHVRCSGYLKDGRLKALSKNSKKPLAIGWKHIKGMSKQALEELISFWITIDEKIWDKACAIKGNAFRDIVISLLKKDMIMLPNLLSNLHECCATLTKKDKEIIKKYGL
jgi:hypothetical protein